MASASPTCRCAAFKLPFGGVKYGARWRRSPTCRAVRAAKQGHSPPVRTSRSTTSRLPTWRRWFADLEPPGSPLARAAAKHAPTMSTATRAGVADDEPLRQHPLRGGLHALIRAPSDHPAMPRKVKTDFTASDDRRAITASNDVGSSRSEGGRGKQVKGVEIRIGGGTSIQPADLPPPSTSSSQLDNGDYLKVDGGRPCGSSTAPPGCARTHARPHSRCWSTRSAWRGWPSASWRRGSSRATGFDRGTSPISHLLYVNDSRRPTPGPFPEKLRLANGDKREFDAWVDCKSRPQRQDGFVTSTDQGDARDPRRKTVPRPRPDRRDSPAASRGPPFSRNGVSCDGSAPSPAMTLDRPQGRGLGDSGAVSITSGSCTGTDRLQARHHGLDGPERRAPEAARGDGDHRRHQADPHQMSGCPNGLSQHHIAPIGLYGASITVGENTIPAYIPHIAGNFEGGDVVVGNRLKARLPPKRVPRRSSGGSELRGGSATTARTHALRRRHRLRPVRRADLGPELPVRVQLGQPLYFIDGVAPSPTRSSAARERARSSGVHSAQKSPQRRPTKRQPPPGVLHGRPRPSTPPFRRPSSEALSFDPRRSPPTSRTRAPRRRSAGRSRPQPQDVLACSFRRRARGDRPPGAQASKDARFSTWTRALTQETYREESRRSSATASTSTAQPSITLEPAEGL